MNIKMKILIPFKLVHSSCGGIIYPKFPDAPDSVRYVRGLYVRIDAGGKAMESEFVYN